MAAFVIMARSISPNITAVKRLGSYTWVSADQHLVDTILVPDWLTSARCDPVLDVMKPGAV